MYEKRNRNLGGGKSRDEGREGGKKEGERGSKVGTWTCKAEPW